MDLEPILKGVLPSIAAALLLVSLGGARWIALAAAIGLYVAFGLLKEWPASPVELWSAPNGIQWLVWAVVMAALVTGLEHLRVWRGRLAEATAVVLAALGTWLMLGKLAARWSSGEVLLQIGGGGLVVALLALAMRRYLGRSKPGLVPAFVVVALLSADAVLLAANGSALLGQLCGAVAAAVGAGVGTALWRRPFALAGADGTWVGIAHGLFLLAGVYLADLSWTLAACAGAVPIVLLVFVRKGGAKG